MVTTDRRRVLMIAYLYPPCTAYPTAAARTSGFARYLPEFGWIPTVLVPERDMTCACDGCVTGSSEEADGSIDIVRVPVTPRALYRLRRAVIPDENQPDVGERQPERSGRRPSALEHALAPARALFETRTTWASEARRAAHTILRNQSFDALWTTSWPYLHLPLGAGLGRSYSIPWVADLRDPVGFVDGSRQPSDWIEEKRRRRYSHHLRNADAIVEVTEPLATRDSLWLGLPCTTVRSGYDPELWKRVTPLRVDDISTFTIVSSGAFYPGVNDPHPFMEGLATFASLKKTSDISVAMWYFGRQYKVVHTAAQRYGIGHLVRDGGFVRPEVFRAYLRGADLIGYFANATGQAGIPGGKLYEYLASGTPILAAPDADPWIREVIRSTSSGAAATEPTAISQFIGYYYEQWARGLEYKRPMADLTSHSILSSAGSLAALLDRLAPRP